MKATYEELERKIAVFDLQLNLSLAAERAWETTMMLACGEDGPKSVSDKFAAIESKCAAMAAENAGMSARTPVAYSYRYAGCETCEGFQDWRWELSKEKPPEWMLETGKVTNLVELFELPETPATDAFLAEVRAQGVEMAACALDDVNQFNYANMLDDLAQKIRQEAAQ